jgi:hypothetical protein
VVEAGLGYSVCGAKLYLPPTRTMEFDFPSRPATASQVKNDVAKVLQHLDVSENHYEKRLSQCEMQIQWVKSHETWDEHIEASQIVSDLEIRQEVLISKVREINEAKNRLRVVFGMG